MLKSKAEKQEKRQKVARVVAGVVVIVCIIVFFVLLAVVFYSEISYGGMLDEFEKNGTYSEDIDKVYIRHLETECYCLAAVILNLIAALLVSMKFRFIKLSFLE